MIGMALASVLFIGSFIVGALVLGFLGGFVIGYVACLENQGKKALAFIGGLILVFVAGYAFLALSGCSPVVRESVTITDVEKTLPVPGDTVKAEMKSDTLEVSGSIVFDTVSTRGRWWVPNEWVKPSRLKRTAKVSFRAAVDTTVSGIRMRLAYRYPEDLWSVLIEQADREVKYRDRDTSGTRTIEGPARFPVWGYIVLTISALMVAWAIFEKVKR